MILTFETKGTDLDIHLDEEGRDYLTGLLSKLQELGDHKHLFRLPGAHSGISAESLDEASTPMESVTLWLLDAKALRAKEKESE